MVSQHRKTGKKLRMKKYKIWILGICNVFTTAMFGGQIELQPSKAFEITLSTTSPNRFICEDGSIVDVVFDESKFDSLIHHKTGEAFISAKKEIDQLPSSVTLVLSSGESQTFQVFANQGPGEIISIRSAKKMCEEKRELTSDYHSYTVEFLNTIMDGRVPYGYGILEPSTEDLLSLQDPLSVQTIRVLEGPFEKIVITEITNSAKGITKLNLEDIRKAGKQWVFLSKKEMVAGETILCITSQRKES